ncbi:hypothetical protein DFQ28_003455 [Apophysomyces sp. BC1034]|nr:hypothetical protein DFQ30_003844 [Apophysomyces sp. BC1015]KAG0178894.1 hypothetical protein DFQ29_002876 [Apophysomyces sp. BC1021]KAG0189406.1 hypothetical protein DFQ28_003455 [Apophysomyces sp. BC1034]
MSLRLLHRITPSLRLRPHQIMLPRHRTFTTAKKTIATATSIQASPAVSPAATTITTHQAAPQPGKFKQLAQKYGAAGVLVYLGVGCVDLGIALVSIELLGHDKVSRLEKVVMDGFKDIKARAGFGKPVEESQDLITEPTEEGERASFASVFLLAYGIHKTLFLPVRLTITAAITPAVVRKLQALGLARYAPWLLGGATKVSPRP